VVPHIPTSCVFDLGSSYRHGPSLRGEANRRTPGAALRVALAVSMPPASCSSTWNFSALLCWQPYFFWGWGGRQCERLTRFLDRAANELGVKDRHQSDVECRLPLGESVKRGLAVALYSSSSNPSLARSPTDRSRELG
jgi:hypothetical protein